MSDQDGAAVLEAIVRGEDPRAVHARFEPEVLRACVAPAAEGIQKLIASDLNAATAAARCLVAVSDRLAAPGSAAVARLVLATALAYANAFDEANRMLDEAAERARSADDAVLEARVASTRMHTLTRQGRLDDAATIGEEALAALRAAGQPMLAARVEANLGVVDRMRRRSESSIEHFRIALADWPDEPIGRAQLRSNLAETLMDLNRFGEAEACFRESLDALVHAGAAQSAAIVEGNLADLLSRQGRLGDALRHYETVRRRYAEAGAPGDAARLQAEQAEAFAQTGLLGEALAEYREAIRQLDASGLVAESVRARLGLVRALLRSNQAVEAGRSLAELPPESGVAPMLRGPLAMVRAEHAAQCGDLEGSERHYSDAVALLDDRPADQAAARVGRTAILLATGRTDEAEEEIERATPSVSACLLRPLEAELARLRAECIRARGREDEGLAALRLAADRFESVRTTLQADRYRCAFAARHGTAAESLVAALVRRGDERSLREALELSERIRGRTLLDLVSGSVDLTTIAAANADDASAARLLREAESVRRQLTGMYGRLEVQPGALLEDSWRRDVLQLEQRIRVVESRLGATQQLGALLGRPLTVDEIVESMGSTALATYIVAEGRLLGIACLKGRLRGADLGDVHEIAEQVERWRFCLHRCLSPTAESAARAKAMESDLERSAQRLCDQVLGPLWPVLAEAEAIQVVPAGPLHAVAFHALPCGGDPLAVRAVTATAPSVSIVAAIRARRRTGAGRTLVVGVADDRAPAIAAEAREIAAIDPNATVLLQDEATIDRFRAEAPDAGVVHLACHGRFLADNPMRSGLRLADGWLTVADLHALRLSSPTVVLSACDTGRVAVEGGQEVAGLLRGFFAAGARAVVMSGWPVHDVAAVELMRDFHSRLALDRSDSPRGFGDIRPASALRSAMLSLRQRRPRIVEWAAFSLAGDAGG
ncbi:MAG: CHAT domain-containing protein [Phycisphaerales bacterium]|nr:CHAT domain-containing protein [Phycisphaerales bacterium]